MEAIAPYGLQIIFFIVVFLQKLNLYTLFKNSKTIVNSYQHL